MTLLTIFIVIEQIIKIYVKIIPTDIWHIYKLINFFFSCVSYFAGGGRLFSNESSKSVFVGVFRFLNSFDIF